MGRAALTLALLLAACGGPQGTAQDSPAPPSPPPEATPEPSPEDQGPEPVPGSCSDQTITGKLEATIRTNDNVFSPQCLIVLAGQGLKLVNRGSTTHNLTIEGSDVDLDVEPGATTRTEVIGGAVAAGTHGFFCSFHRSQGMDGEITVTEAG